MSQHSTGLALTPTTQTNELNRSKERRRTKQRPTCDRCGSKRWRRDPNRGVVVCGEGHVLEGYIQESTEQTELSQYSTRRRRIRVGPKRKKAYILKNAYQGERARLLLLQSLTLLLRKQIESIISIINAPPILEDTARALWQSYLSTLSLQPEVLVHARPSSPTNSFSESQFGGSQSGYSSQDSRWSNTSHESQPRASSKSPRSSTIDDDILINSSVLTPETLKSITDRADSDSSDHDSLNDQSQSGFESQQTDDTRPVPSSHNSTNIQIHPRIEVTICTLYLACLKLRLPIILQDLINLISTKQIPYIGFIHSLPQEVKQKMNWSVRSHLSIEKPPRLCCAQSPAGLTFYCRKLIGLLLHKAQQPILTPQDTLPNLSLLVLRFSQSLLLPTALQALSLHLLSKLESSLILTSLPTTTASTDRVKKTGRSNSKSSATRSDRQMVTYPPEWIVMATIYYTIQLVLLFNHKKSLHQNLNDADPEQDQMLSFVMDSFPDLDSWVKGLNQLTEIENRPDPQHLSKLDLMSMCDSEIDSYLDFAEEFLLKDETTPKDIRLRERLFNSESLSIERDQSSSKEKTDESRLTAAKKIQSEECLKILNRFKQIDSSNQTGSNQDLSSLQKNQEKFKKVKANQDSELEFEDKLIKRMTEMIGLINHWDQLRFQKLVLLVQKRIESLNKKQRE